MHLPVGQIESGSYWGPSAKYVAICGVFHYIGQVNFAYGQVKVEDHLPLTSRPAFICFTLVVVENIAYVLLK